MVCNRTDLMRVHQLVKTPIRLRTAHPIVLTLKEVGLFSQLTLVFRRLIGWGLYTVYIYIYYVNAKYYINWG